VVMGHTVALVRCNKNMRPLNVLWNSKEEDNSISLKIYSVF